MIEAMGGRGSADAENPPACEIVLPHEQTVPFVFNSPHSGRYYPADFLSAACLDQQEIRRSEDFLVDRLFAPVVKLGAPLMSANYPRAYLDVNREPYELDPKMFAGRLPSFVNVRSLRVAGGLGTIPRVVSDAANIYKGPLAVEEALSRIERIYRPYHDTLRRLLAQTHVAFGMAVLVDCHSMPSNIRGASSRVRPDFVLGDRFGASCMPELTDRASSALQALGYTVCRNKPYAGGFITEHYGRPARGLHALQIEVNRALYMDECNLEPHAGFGRLSSDLSALACSLLDFVEELNTLREAAE
jgi:N-formylglutamate amidohydrolase